MKRPAIGVRSRALWGEHPIFKLERFSDVYVGLRRLIKTKTQTTERDTHDENTESTGAPSRRRAKIPLPMSATNFSRSPFVPQSVPESFMKSRLYQAFCAERAEILRHKWIESEKAGRDIGFDVALFDWIVHHHTAWRRAYLAKLGAENKA